MLEYLYTSHYHAKAESDLVPTRLVLLPQTNRYLRYSEIVETRRVAEDFASLQPDQYEEVAYTIEKFGVVSHVCPNSGDRVPGN
jgi:hypothetical protein